MGVMSPVNMRHDFFAVRKHLEDFRNASYVDILDRCRKKLQKTEMQSVPPHRFAVLIHFHI